MMCADGATTNVTSRGKRKSADALVNDDVNKAGDKPTPRAFHYNTRQIT